MIANYFNITRIEKIVINICVMIFFCRDILIQPKQFYSSKQISLLNIFVSLEVPNTPGSLSLTAETGCISVSADSSYQFKTTLRVSSTLLNKGNGFPLLNFYRTPTSCF